MDKVLQDFVEIGYDYKKLHDQYVSELEAEQKTHGSTLGDIPPEKGGKIHQLQTKINALYNLYKNGELPIQPVEDDAKKLEEDVKSEVTEDKQELKSAWGAKNAQGNTPGSSIH